MKQLHTRFWILVLVLAVGTIVSTGTSCNKAAEKAAPTDTLLTSKVESFHSFFDHHGYLDEARAFFAPEIMKTHKVKTAKFFDHFSGKPDFAKDLPDEIKHIDENGRITKEEFLSIDSASYSYGSESWKYDDAGRLSESRIVYPNSTKITQIDYKYDESGRLISIDTKAYHSVTPDTAVHYKLVHELTYVSKGNIPSQIVHTKDNAEIGQISTQWLGDTLVYKYKGEDEMEIRFMCDSLGRVMEMLEIDELPMAFNKKHIYGYDLKSRINSKDEHLFDGSKYELINQTVWSYNEAGLLSGEDVFSVKGKERKLVDQSTIEYTFH